jgi:hypothetical protein
MARNPGTFFSRIADKISVTIPCKTDGVLSESREEEDK